MLLILVLLAGVTGAGGVIGYLIVSGNWIYGAVLLGVIPALVVLHQYPFVGILIWLLLMPFLLHTQDSASRQVYWLVHRFLPLITLLFLFLSSSFGKNRRLPKLTIVEYSMGGYILVSVISILLFNNQQAVTLYRFYDLFFVPMALYLVIRLYIPNRQGFTWLMPVLVFITVTQVVIGLLSWIMPGLLPSAWLEYAGARTTGSLNSVSVYTTTLIFTGLVLLNYSYQLKTRWKQAFMVVLFLLSIYATIISYSRASWLAGILILMALVFMYPKLMGRMAIVLVVAFIAVGPFILQSGFLERATNRLSSEESDNSALSRLPVYLAAVRMFAEKPVFGWGYDNFDRFDRKYQSRVGDLVNPDEKDHTSHNMYLTMLAEQGLVGTGLYLLPFAVLFWRSIRTDVYLPKYGILNKKLFWSLWLVILAFFIVQNLAPMVVVFGIGLNWITLGLIANFIHTYKP